jgi:hypothetical protein
MKKVFFLITYIFLTAAIVYAGASLEDQWSENESGSLKYAAKISCTDNVATEVLPTKLLGTYLYEVKLITSTDDTVDLSIDDEDGVPFFSKSYTSATSGDRDQPDAFWLITPLDNPTYSLSNMDGGGTATLIFKGIVK